MKKLLITLIACTVPMTAMADRDRFEHREHHGGVNPWPFVAGAVIGGIIVNEVNRDREYRPPMRYVTICEDLALYDSYGRYVRTERQCRKQLVEE